MRITSKGQVTIPQRRYRQAFPGLTLICPDSAATDLDETLTRLGGDKA